MPPAKNSHCARALRIICSLHAKSAGQLDEQNQRRAELRLARRAQLTQEELQLMKNAASSALIQQALQLTATKGSGSKNLAAAAKWLSILQQQELR
jgi:hypothetical protein